MTIHGQGLRIGQQLTVTQTFNRTRQAAGIIKFFHQEAAGRHQIHNGRHVPAKPGPVIQTEFDTDASGNRFQMNHRIGGTADGGIHRDGIFKGRPGQYFR